MATVIKHLELAKKYIDASWTKGTFHRKNKDSETGWTVCAMGALTMAALKLGDNTNVFSQLHAALPENKRPYGVISFNDNPATTQEDVQNLFKRAICLAKNAATQEAAPSPTPSTKKAKSSRSVSAAGGKKVTGVSTAKARPKAVRKRK